MPYSMDNPPSKIKNMPKHAQEIFIAAFNAAIKEYDDEGKASAVAYSAVKKAGYSQDDKGDWHKTDAIRTLWDSIKRLFAPLVEDDSAELADMQVTLPTQTRSFVITRDAQGVPRWLMIAASAVVNKVGAIDSTILFDNFIRHASELGEYPVLDFLHEGERVRFGMADWLKRDGALYLASGGFDDTELARAAIAGLEAQPGYWGASIAYRVTQAPLILQAEGNIPVYMDGVNNFISVVPKRMAANLFTATLIAKEVKERMDAKTYEELVKLVGAERAAQFASQVDDANRTITDTGMVVRSDDTPTTTEPAPEAPPVIPPAPVVEVRQEPPAPATEEKPDDLAEIKATVAALAERLSKLEQSISAGIEESRQVQQRATDKLADIDSRLAGVEASKERWDTWLNDAPEHMKQEAETVFRARNQEPAPMTLAQIAEQNTAKMNRGPHFRRQQQG